MINSECVFCKIVSGEIGSSVVYEDEYFKGILDISPVARGHVVLILKKHLKDIFELEEEDMSKIYSTVAKIAKGIEAVTKCEGINIVQNNREAAGQTVFHFHIHIIPRFLNDNINLQNEGIKYNEDINKLAEEIKSNIIV